MTIGLQQSQCTEIKEGERAREGGADSVGRR